MPKRTIANRRVIITGASSGIGAALARAFVAAGAQVTLTARRAERLDAIISELNTSELNGSTTSAYALAGDITDAAHREALIRFAVDSMGGVDTLINNAGTGAIGPFLDADAERLRKIMDVNFFAPAELIRQAAPELKSSQDGVVVNIGSVLGHRAMPSKSEYCASKFAMHGLSDALRAELADEIDVILVSPSTTKSEFFDQLLENDGSAAKNPYGMTPEQVASKTLSALRSGKHEVILSAGGKLLVWLDRLSPALAGWVAKRYG